jgi:sugar lactone lactonase YvrE
MKKALFTLATVFYLHTNAQIISTVAGDNNLGFSGDGNAAITAELDNPSGVVHDNAGNLYIVDQGNNRIRKVNASGVISTIAGNGPSGSAGSYGGDGGQATAAELNGPTCVAFDALGNMYIADAGNNRIRMVNASGVISTVVGTGTAGFSGDGSAAPTAELKHPTGIAIVGTTAYIADYSNNRIRMVNSSGIISTIAGNGTAGATGDAGQATAAELNGPAAVTVDASGNIYIADLTNNRIRKINASGVISTYAGTGTLGSTGDGGQATAAELGLPSGIAVDAAGNLYIADFNNNKIRKVSAGGIIATIAGTGVAFYSGDGSLATAARLSAPRGVAFDNSGNMYIADDDNNVIRMVTNVAAAGIEQISDNSSLINIYPNPSNGNISVTNQNNISEIKVTDMIGQIVYEAKPNAENTTLQLTDNGVYFVTITTDKGISTKKIIVNK